MYFVTCNHNSLLEIVMFICVNSQVIFSQLHEIIAYSSVADPLPPLHLRMGFYIIFCNMEGLQKGTCAGAVLHRIGG